MTILDELCSHIIKIFIMNEKLLILAIHTFEKANILKDLLEKNGIEVHLEKVVYEDTNIYIPNNSYYVKINSDDLLRAIPVIEASQLFSNEENIEFKKIDDGRGRILVAVDFSPYSIKACQVAFNIAKEINAKVKILHVYHNIYFPSHIPFADSLKESPNEGLLNKIRKQMLDLCLDIDKKITDKEWPSINYSYSLREGVIDEEIENFVQEYKPNLLVLGTRGSDNNQAYVLGNVTADVIEIVNVPVLAVPENSPIESISDIKHVAFLTNLQERDLSSFNMLVNILNYYQDIKITLLHINRKNSKGDTWNEYELIKMSEHFKRLYPQINIGYKLIDSTDIPMAVHNYVESENVTIICLNTRRRNLLGRIFAPSISRKVLINSDKALLVLRG